PGPPGGLGVGAERRAHAVHLVGRDRHTRPGPAGDDTHVCTAAAHRLADLPAHLGPGITFGDRHHRVARGAEPGLDRGGHPSWLVGAERDAHASIIADATDGATPPRGPTGRRRGVRSFRLT